MAEAYDRSNLPPNGCDCQTKKPTACKTFAGSGSISCPPLPEAQSDNLPP